MIVYLLAAFGLAYIVGHSTISLPFRKWLGGTPAKAINPIDFIGTNAEAFNRPAKPGALGPLGDFLTVLIECPACFGFWTGVAIGLAGMLQPPPELSAFGWPFTLGCVTAGSNFALSRLTRLID